MNRAISSAAVVAVATALGFTLMIGLAPPVAIGAQVVLPMTTKVMWLPDAGRLYVADTLDVDGGLTLTTVSPAPCKRKLPGQITCLTTSLGVPPLYNRYPASALIGVCDSVACVVPQTVDPGEANNDETYSASDILLVLP